MTKVRKQRKAKRFNHGVNRKKMNNKRKIPLVKDKTLRESWEEKKTTVQNLAEMGLAYDPNKAIPLPGKKAKPSTDTVPALIEEDKTFVSETIEKEATAPMKKIFRLPKAQVETLSKLLDKYGGNFHEMAKDKLNIFQYTPKQLKQKVKQFKNIPEQWQPYLESRKQNNGPKLDDKSAVEVEALTISEKRKKKRLAKRGAKLETKANASEFHIPDQDEESMEEDDLEDSEDEHASEEEQVSEEEDTKMKDATTESSVLGTNEKLDSSKTDEGNSEKKKKKRRKKKKNAVHNDSNMANKEETSKVSIDNGTGKKKRRRKKKKNQQNTDNGVVQTANENSETSKTSVVETSHSENTPQSQKKKRPKKSKGPSSGSPTSPAQDKGRLLAMKLQKKREKRKEKKKALKSNKPSP